MLDIRAMDREALKEAAALANRTFKGPGEPLMEDGFPSIFSGAYHSSYGLYEGGKLVAFMGLVPHRLCIGGARVPMYALGSVCTDADFQGRGYAGKLLERVFAHMEEAEASILYVSGTGKLYTRNGCLPFGGVRTYRLSRGLATPGGSATAAYRFREARESDRFRLHELYESEPVRYERSMLETGLLLQAEALAGINRFHHHVTVALRDGIIEAYAVLAVRSAVPAESNPHVTEGISISESTSLVIEGEAASESTPLVIEGEAASESTPFMVEGAGSVEALEALLDYALTSEVADELDVIVPWHDETLRERLNHHPHKDDYHSGTIRIVNPELLWRALTPYLAERDAEALTRIVVANDGTASDSGENVRLTVDGETAVLNPGQWVSLLFTTEGFMPFADEKRNAVLKALLPVPLPYPSGLNFI